jgi:hypothetical protein
VAYWRRRLVLVVVVLLLRRAPAAAADLQRALRHAGPETRAFTAPD